MGILDDLKNKVEKLGDRAKEGFDDAKDKAGDLLDDAKDKAGDLVDDAKERLGHHDEGAPLAESGDVGPDTTSTDAVQPGYVTAEDDVDDPESGEDSLDDDSDDTDDPEVEDEVLVAAPAVETDVDPYEQPLTESIGDELANALAAQEVATDTIGTDQDPKA